MIKTNFHTHTTFCDGKNTPEEMVQSAIEKGFSSLGFSVHSPMFYAPEHGIAEENVDAYIADVRAMAKKYSTGGGRCKE